MQRLMLPFNHFLLFLIVFFSSHLIGASRDSNTVLEVKGLHDDFTQSTSVELSMRALKELPEQIVSTQNPWEEGTHNYKGFNPHDLLKSLNMTADLLRIKALNQYVTEIPISDFEASKAIIAYDIDGHNIPVRNKGPLMVIYNFDQNATLRNETYYGRSIWQIQSIEVVQTGD